MRDSGYPALSNSPEAFLSYTRLDDEFFGGAITSLRRLLELGVQVVSGDRNFNIFQDVDGIEFGQKWQQRLNEAISSSRFLVCSSKVAYRACSAVISAFSTWAR